MAGCILETELVSSLRLSHHSDDIDADLGFQRARNDKGLLY